MSIYYSKIIKRDIRIYTNILKGAREEENKCATWRSPYGVLIHVIDVQ